MTRLRLTKKLQPAKKAWRSFSTTVQSKVQKLNISKAIKTTIQRLVSTFHSLRHLISSKTSRHRSLPSRPYYCKSSSSYHHVQRKNFSAICIDDLYAEPSASSSSVSVAKGETRRRGKAETGSKDLGGGESSNGLNTIEDAWKVVVANSPNLQVAEKAEKFIEFREDKKLRKERCLPKIQERLAVEDAWEVVVAKSPILQVDEKAEEFIKKFRKDMKLQKERSLLEFQERLARSS